MLGDGLYDPCSSFNDNGPGMNPGRQRLVGEATIDMPRVLKEDIAGKSNL